jgi:hypothetical protein
MSSPPHPSDLITLTIFGEEYRLWIHHYAIISMIYLPPF